MKKKTQKKKHDCRAELHEVIQYLSGLVHADHSQNLEYASQHGEKDFWDKHLKLNCDALSLLNYLTTLDKE